MDVVGQYKKISAKCLLILSVEMIFILDGFANDQINKISLDGRCHACFHHDQKWTINFQFVRNHRKLNFLTEGNFRC